jgi:menaquinone-specific isochorismate synthase
MSPSRPSADAVTVSPTQRAAALGGSRLGVRSNLPIFRTPWSIAHSSHPSAIHTPTTRSQQGRVSAPAPALHLVTVELPASGLEPETFLAAASGSPRGLWARGERWVAHRGVLAVLSVEAGVRDRFGEIAMQAGTLPVPVDPRDRVRLYGGFAFGEEHEARGDWTGFPSALFHLPEIELTGDASAERVLRVRALTEPARLEPTRRALRQRAERVLDEVTRASEGSPPETRGLEAGAPEALLRALRRSAWEGAVDEVLGAIAAGRVSKVVLARTLDVDTASAVDPVEVVRALRQGNPGTHVFLFEPEPGRVLLGAAPEAVATLRRGVFHATAVAGSVARGETPGEQAALARALLASAKDRAEQRVVVEDMVSRLAALAQDIEAESEPHVLTLARIQHLETEIRARVDPGRTVLDLVAALHPTPAVCGVPRDAALALLRHEEPFERGWYAGPVGWFTLDGDGHFVPALRTAVGGADGWRLFAGAGIVEGSHPPAEWDETAIKFQPVLRALAQAGVRLPGGLNGSGPATAGGS